MSNYGGGTWGPIADEQVFMLSLTRAMQQLPQDGLFCSDNLLAWWRNLSFLDDPHFMNCFRRHAQTEAELGIIWRTHVYTWCVKQALRRSGDLVEAGCYQGTSVRIACDVVDFARYKNKFYLYDLFEHRDGMRHHGMTAHGPQLYAQVQARFADLSNVVVVRGEIPAVLRRRCPRRIAFLHLDLNDAQAEEGALAHLFPRLVPGSIVLLDDYGWQSYRAQRDAADRFFSVHGLEVAELPTGQGLVLV